MNSGRQVASQFSLLSLALRRSFSKSSLSLRLSQNMPPSQSEWCWISRSCLAVAFLGLGLSFFSTRQLHEDPNRRALPWEK